MRPLNVFCSRLFVYKERFVSIIFSQKNSVKSESTSSTKGDHWDKFGLASQCENISGPTFQPRLGHQVSELCASVFSN